MPRLGVHPFGLLFARRYLAIHLLAMISIVSQGGVDFPEV